MNAPEQAPVLADTTSADLFITVPETTLPNGIVVPSFMVGQYACTQGSENQASVAAGTVPWVNISYHEARAACEKAGYSLITELQWLAIAHDVARQDCNWTKGKVGKGKLFRGIRKGTVSSAQPGNIEPADKKERRWLTLSNGERICDLNGNVWQWVFDDVQGNDKGIIARAFAADSPSLQAPYPSMEKGMGWRPDPGSNLSGGALVRGGCWGSRASAGVFFLDYDGPGNRLASLSFRCTK